MCEVHSKFAEWVGQYQTGSVQLSSGDLALKAWQHQQAEIDSLKNALDGMTERNNFLSSVAYEADSLQKQIDAQQRRIEALKRQLVQAGFTDNGGYLLKPPLGSPPNFKEPILPVQKNGKKDAKALQDNGLNVGRKVQETPDGRMCFDE